MIRSLIILVLLAGAACAQSPTLQSQGDEATPGDCCDPGADAVGGQSVVEFLDKLEARGREIRNYHAKLTYKRTQGLLGDEQTRIGEVWYDTNQTSKFAVVFTHLLVDGALRERPRSYVFDGVWLAEVMPDEKQFFRRQVVEPGKTYDPLELGRGPFPLPLGQKRQQVMDIFNPQLVEAAADDPADSIHLHLTPRTDDDKPRSEFTRVDIWYDKQTLLPLKIETADESENVTTVTLKDAVVNAADDPQAAERFDTTPPAAGSGWHVEITPLEKQAE